MIYPHWIAECIKEGHTPTACKSNAGWYIGAWDRGPYARYSEEYWPEREDAEAALAAGAWTPRVNP